MTLPELLSTIWPNEYAFEPYQQQSFLQMYLNSFDTNLSKKQQAMHIAEKLHEPDRVTACIGRRVSRR